jgi:hypothetical protein
MSSALVVWRLGVGPKWSYSFLNLNLGNHVMIQLLNYPGLTILFSQICFVQHFFCLTIFFNRECPEDCREAVSSLMSAAARFSDLPELRDLRQIFQERYGNSLKLFVNQKVMLYELTLNNIIIIA